MRTTVDLPENLHRIASGLARHTRRSLSETVVDLIQRGLDERPFDGNAPRFAVGADTGLPVVRSRRAITADDVHALDNDA
ncbi:MAG: hypothetical protein WKG52_07010 [Variovorax sp.]